MSGQTTRRTQTPQERPAAPSNRPDAWRRIQPMENGESRGARDTARTEAFSDGVFAFAITLLVLNLHDPSSRDVTLSEGLINEAPFFFAMVTSFITILVMWLNHHNMFSHIDRVDRRLMPRDPAIERQSAQNATSTIANLILPGSLGLSVPDNPKSAEKIRESRAILRARYGSLYDDVLGFWRNTIRSGLHR